MSNCSYGCFCPVEPIINEHVISMAATSKTSKCKLLSVQEKLDITNMVDAT
jgi:hypothetical protein